jgi:gamma-glutamyltranspeptidase
LEGFRAIAYPPIHQEWNGKTIYTTSAPTSGAMLLAILNLIEEYDFPSTPESEGGCNSPLNTHRLLEAMKLAFGARSEVTDPAFASEEQKERYHEFTTKEWANENRHKITDVRLSPGSTGSTRDMVDINEGADLTECNARRGVLRTEARYTDRSRDDPPQRPRSMGRRSFSDIYR